METVQFLFLPIQPFVQHPERIAIVSGIFCLWFLGVYLPNRKHMQFQYWLLLACAVAWGLFAMWEVHCNVMRYDIRVDLLLIHPVLMGFSAFSIIINIIRLPSLFRRKQKKDRV